MEQPAASEFAQHGDQIEVTAPNRTDFGKRYQVESSRPSYIHVLDNRLRVQIEHTDYKIVKRCGKPASEQPKKKVGRPSNAELAARAVEAAKEATKDVPASPTLNDKYSVKVDASGIVKGFGITEEAPVVTAEELAALEKAIDVPVTRKVKEEFLTKLAEGLGMLKPDTEAKTSTIADIELKKAQVGDIIKITGGSHLIDPKSKYVAGTELRVHTSAVEVIARQLDNYAPTVWNFIVKHGEYEIVSTASQEKALQDVPVEIVPPLKPIELTQEQFDAMTNQGPITQTADHLTVGGVNWIDADTLKRATIPNDAPKYSHYFKSCPFSHVDIYRMLLLFDVTDPCLQHAIKKLLVAGGRGHKDIQKDVQESIDALARWQAMRAEEQAAA
jgi:hypothetical protein